MKDLNTEVQKVWAASTLEDKRQLMIDLINTSHATPKTKKLSIITLNKIRRASDVDSFAVNYMMSGMGMKVI